MNHLKLLIVILAVAAFSISCGESAPAPIAKNTTANTTAIPPANTTVATTPVQSTAAVADDGSIGSGLYAKNCMICHKDSGKGGKVSIEGKELEPVDLTSAKMKARPDDKLLSGIKNGAPDDGMPAFAKKLSDDEIKEIVKHVRNLQSAK